MERRYFFLKLLLLQDITLLINELQLGKNLGKKLLTSKIPKMSALNVNKC